MARYAPRRHVRRKPMAEMNVVPYIDVMLVLLVIFMVTAPLLSQGVKVDLPQAPSEPMTRDQTDPLIVSVDRQGNYFLNVGAGKDSPLDEETLMVRVAAVLKHRPGTPVYVKADKQVNYGTVVYAMTLLQRAGVPSVGLVTQPPQGPRG